MNEVIAVRHRPFGPKSERFRELLRRYPGLPDHELSELSSIYRRLSVMDMALLAADETVAGHFEAFARDQGSSARLGGRCAGVAFSLLAGFAAIASAVWVVAS